MIANKYKPIFEQSKWSSMLIGTRGYAAFIKTNYLRMKTKNSLFVLILMSVVILYQCEPLDKVSDVPEIVFKKYTAFMADTLDMIIPAGELEFSFIDGDSDFGSTSADNDSNMVLLPYQKINGDYDSIDAGIYGRQYTVAYNEYLDRSENTVRGKIKVQIFYFVPPPYDTIRYDFYIKDNAGHKSNIASSSDIAF